MRPLCANTLCCTKQCSWSIAMENNPLLQKYNKLKCSAEAYYSRLLCIPFIFVYISNEWRSWDTVHGQSVWLFMGPIWDPLRFRKTSSLKWFNFSSKIITFSNTIVVVLSKLIAETNQHGQQKSETCICIKYLRCTVGLIKSLVHA